MFDRRQADSFGGFILEHEQMAELSQVCLICGTQPFRYRCPRCQAKLCGLACVKQHKKEWDCDGHRAKTDFVPLRQFDNLTLLNGEDVAASTMPF